MVVTLDLPLTVVQVKIYGARVRVDGMAKVAEIEAAEKEKMKGKVDKILAHGINCFINRQLIYNYPEELFSEAGVMAIEHADFDGIERLALVTGGWFYPTHPPPPPPPCAVRVCLLLLTLLLTAYPDVGFHFFFHEQFPSYPCPRFLPPQAARLHPDLTTLPLMAHPPL